MAYEFECKNVVPGCEGKVSGDTEEAVLSAAAAHAQEAHGMSDLSDDVVDKVKASIAPTT